MKEESEAEIRKRITERMSNRKSYCDLLKEFEVDERKASAEYDAIFHNIGKSTEGFIRDISIGLGDHFFGMARDENRHHDIIKRMVDKCVMIPWEEQFITMREAAKKKR